MQPTQPSDSPRWQRWREGQRRHSVRTRTGEHEVAVHVEGSGRDVVLLHGFPSWSGDWSLVVDGLGHRRRTIAPDLLGFGWSAKPADHGYSIVEQADVVEDLVGALGVTDAVVVAHDYGTSVAQELLSRAASGGRLHVSGLVLMNGGVYPDLHRPTAGQQLLLSDDGAAIAAGIDRAAFEAAVAPTFHQPPPTDVIDGMWAALTHGGGNLQLHRLMHYVADRAEHGDRWVAAMEAAAVPIAFVWGLDDDVAGRHVLDRIAERMPTRPRTALPHVGHWPPIEAPAAIIDAVLALP